MITLNFPKAHYRKVPNCIEFHLTDRNYLLYRLVAFGTHGAAKIITKYASKQLFHDDIFALECIRHYPPAIESVPKNIRFTNDFTQRALRANPLVMSSISKSPGNQYITPEIALECMEANPSCWAFILRLYKFDMPILILAIKKDPRIYSRLSLKHRKFVLMLVCFQRIYQNRLILGIIFLNCQR
jgi:hypothetical protein